MRSASQGLSVNDQAHDFTYTDNTNPHTIRSREILARYPQIRKLMGHYPLSGAYILLVVAAQLAVAWLMTNQSWPVILLVAYGFGAFANHALFVLIHDASHDLVGKSKAANQMWGIICNIPQLLPSAAAFRVYHIIHHSHLNEYDYDADLAFHKEATWVGSSRLKKALWFVTFMLIEAVRPMRLKKGTLFSPWIAFNILFIVTTSSAIYLYLGPIAFYYLLLSNIFSVGLHPVGARWIQEHYTYQAGQETYSYYGPLNTVAFNIGYHNEHHDFFRVPWVHLPKIKKIAPEYYDSLYAHRSWSALLYDFIMNPKRSLYDRIVRRSRPIASS